MKSAQEFSMKLSLGLGSFTQCLLGGIAIYSLQVALMPEIATARPVSEISQIAQETVVQVIDPTPDSAKTIGAIIQRDGEFYSVLIARTIGSEIRQIQTFDSQVYDIVTARSVEVELKQTPYTIVQFRSRRNYQVIALSDGKDIARNSSVYLSGRHQGKFHLEPSRVIFNNSDEFWYDNQQVNLPYDNELILNSSGELIGFHWLDKWSVNRRARWPIFQDYPYPTLQTLDLLYEEGHPFPDCGLWRNSRELIRFRYHRGTLLTQLQPALPNLHRTTLSPRDRQVQLIAANSPFAQALGNTFRHAHSDPKMTIASLDRAIQAEPLNAELYSMRGDIRAWDQGDPVEAEINQRKAFADYAQALALNPQDSYTLWLRSKLKERLKDYPGMVADLDRLIILNPQDSATIYLRGQIKQHQLKDFPGALMDYNRLADLNPLNRNVYLNRGLLKEHNLKDFAGALADYQILLNLKPSPAIYDFIARFKAEKMQDYIGALADYTQMIKIDGNNAENYSRRGKLKSEKIGDFPGALADYRQAIALNSRYFKLYQQRATVYIQLRDLASAAADYDAAIALYASAENLRIRANFKADLLQDLPAALADYDQAVALEWNPKDYYERGLFKARKLLDRAGAIADFQKAVRRLKEIESEQGEALQGLELELLGKIQVELHRYQ
jgi:tetratricopeptide (TPR) repeat protein